MVVEDLVDGSGEVKSRRRMSRPLVKEVLTTVIEVDSAVVVVDGVATEEEVMVGMANHSVDVEDTEVVMAKPLPSNYYLPTS